MKVISREDAGRIRHLEQLVAEALEHFTDADSLVDLREWVRTARAALRVKAKP